MCREAYAPDTPAGACCLSNECGENSCRDASVAASGEGGMVSSSAGEAAGLGRADPLAADGVATTGEPGAVPEVSSINNGS